MRKDSARETTMLTVKGLRLYVALEQGDESLPPLLLINGIGANLELFDPFIEALDHVGGHKIGTIRFDVPGIGKSPLPPRSCARNTARRRHSHTPRPWGKRRTAGVLAVCSSIR